MTEVTRGFCWHQNFAPWGCLPLTCGYIYLLNHKKMCIKSKFEEILFNFQKMTIVMRPSCWHQNFGPNGLSAPAQGLCLNFFSSITADFNISSALRWAIQDQWSSGYYYKRLITLILSIQHRVLKYYQICSNDDTGQLCFLMLLHGWQLKQHIVMCFQACSAYPMHSGERYRTNGPLVSKL